MPWPSAALGPVNGSSNATGTLLPGGSGVGCTASGPGDGGGGGTNGCACGIGSGAGTFVMQAPTVAPNKMATASRTVRGREGIERTAIKDDLPREPIARRA